MSYFIFKLAQRCYFACNFYCKKFSILGSLRNAEKPDENVVSWCSAIFREERALGKPVKRLVYARCANMSMPLPFEARAVSPLATTRKVALSCLIMAQAPRFGWWCMRHGPKKDAQSCGLHARGNRYCATCYQGYCPRDLTVNKHMSGRSCDELYEKDLVR